MSVKIGSPAQIEWAERIAIQVSAEFDRVASAFRAVAEKQEAGRRRETETVLAVLEQIRLETMSRDDAGYFITQWQDIGDQVRQRIAKHPTYIALKQARASRRL